MIYENGDVRTRIFKDARDTQKLILKNIDGEIKSVISRCSTRSYVVRFRSRRRSRTLLVCDISEVDLKIRVHMRKTDPLRMYEFYEIEGLLLFDMFKGEKATADVG